MNNDKSIINVSYDQEKLVVDLPLHVDLPRKTKKDKRIYLDKNTEHNLSKWTYNEAKKQYTKCILEDLEPIEIQFKDPVGLYFTVYKKNKAVCDLGNYSIIEKFTSDALVKAGILPDDNFNYVKFIAFSWGGFAEQSKCILEIVKL